MRYLMSSKWALTERFAITDEAGTPAFEVHGSFGLVQHVKFQDASGREVAELKKHMVGNRYEILVGGHKAAEVRHTGLFGQHYEVETGQGRIDAQGDFAGWDYTLTRGPEMVASVQRQMALREKFIVDVSPGQDDVFVLAVVLAIDNIHDERRGEDHGGGMLGGGGLGGGLLGGL